MIPTPNCLKLLLSDSWSRGLTHVLHLVLVRRYLSGMIHLRSLSTFKLFLKRERTFVPTH